MSHYFKTLEIKSAGFISMIIIFLLTATAILSLKIASGHSSAGETETVAGITEIKPAAGDTHHLEVKPESLEGYRIPNMEITVKAIPQDGSPVIEKKLDEMFGGNFHYGANITLEPKQYLLQFHLDPPTFMREGKRASQWLEPINAEFAFDASAPVETSGKIGTKQTADMKISFEAEDAESMFMISGEDTHTEMESMRGEETASAVNNTRIPSAISGILGVIAGFIIGRFLFKAK